MSKLRIAILGAGPTGLEAALAAAEAGLPFNIYEAAPGVLLSGVPLLCQNGHDS
jgi:NADPH-dependent 2,4-dienoyl-CoA reductase/sulfur reductase-like enzyme